MAVTHHKSSRVIRGKTYAYNGTFICYEANKGNAASEGNGSSAAALTKGATYIFKGYAIDDDTGKLTAYPYLIADSLGNNRGWYKENVFPYATYTIEYDANGGSGAPASQIKLHGVGLNLTSSTPQKIGYTFKGWALTNADANSGKWYYQPGSTCGQNKDLTLYAVWASNTYTITFDANGGKGAPEPQYKTPGVDLTISSTKPTREGYIFKGWASSATSATVVYNPGGTYIADISFTLYAVWVVAPKPTITNVSVYRCNSDKTANDEGQYLFVAFDWSTETEVISVHIADKALSESEWYGGTVSASGKSGHFGNRILRSGNAVFDTETSYQVKITVTDSNGETYVIREVPPAEFPFDMRRHGVSFGRPATLDNTADFEYEIYARNGIKFPVLASGTNFNEVRTPGQHPFGAATTFGYVNCPISSATSGVLEVIQAGDGAQLLQRITTCSRGTIRKWERCYHEVTEAAWGSWVRTDEISFPAATLPALTAYLNSNQTTVASAYTPIVFNTGLTNYGLSLMTSGGIKIGDGISYVLVSLTVCFSGIKANGNKHIKIKKNSADYDWVTGYATTGGDFVLTISPRLMKVSKDDIISATYHSYNAGEIISAGNASNGFKTCLTVVAVM